MHLNLIMETKHLMFMITKFAPHNMLCQLLRCNSTENQIDAHLKLLVFSIQFFSQATNPLLKPKYLTLTFKRCSCALVLGHPMLFADHRLKFLILINCKQQGHNSTCCSMMSLLITMISLNMLACSSNVAWSTTIKPLIDNWVFLKIHYSEEHLLRQRCLNHNYQTFWKTTEWYWMIFRCVGTSL